MARKNNLSQNTPVKSDLHDIDVDNRRNLEDVMPEDARESNSKRPTLDCGWYAFRVTDLEHIDTYTYFDRFGTEKTSESKYVIEFTEVRTGEKIKHIVKDEKVSGFIWAINKRSGGDWGFKAARGECSYKLNGKAIKYSSIKDLIKASEEEDKKARAKGEEVNPLMLALKQACKYANQYPVHILYEYNTWTDTDTNEMKQTKYPVLHMWMNDDFEDKTPRTKISFDD